MRQVKFFKIRLGPAALKTDESWLNEFLASASTKKTVPALVQTAREVFWSIYVEYETEKRPVAESPKSDRGRLPTGDQQELYEALRTWRNQRAFEEHIPAYMIFHNAHLRQMVESDMSTVDEIAQIPGVGTVRASKYGADVLRIIKEHQPPTARSRA